MIDRSGLRTILEQLLAARREAQADLDAAQSGALASPGLPSSEEMPQTLAALVRQLDTAAREVKNAIYTLDQKQRVAARLNE